MRAFVALLFVSSIGCELMVLEDPPAADAALSREDVRVDDADTNEVRTPFDAAGRPSRCPLDVIAKSSATMGPDGGELKLVGGQEPHGVPFTIRVPPRALTETVTITVSEIAEVPSPGVSLMSPVYLIEPFDLRFAKPSPIMVTWPASATGGPMGFLVVYTAADGGTPFSIVPDSYINAGFLNASIAGTGFVFAGSHESVVGTICR